MKSIKSLINTNFLSSSSVIFAGSFVVNVLNYVFTLIVSRLMGVEAFGEVAAMISLLLVISVPATALTMLMAREVASRSIDKDNSIRDLFLFLRRHVIMAIFAFWAIFLILIPFLSHFFHIDYVPFLIFSALIPLSAVGALQTGTMQGLHEFFIISKQNVLSASIKLLLSILLIYMGFSVPGVMIALVIAAFAGWLYGYFATHNMLGLHNNMQKPVLDSKTISKLFSGIFITVLLLVLLSNTDVLLAKHYLSSIFAGQYGALSIMGNIIIYGIGAFTTVLLPMASAARAKGEGKEKHLLGLSLSIIATAAFVAWVLFSLFPQFFVNILFGQRYLPIAAYLGMYALASGFVALSIALINYFVAIRNTSFMYLLFFGIAFEVVLIYFNHGSIEEIVSMFVISSTTLLALMITNYFKTQTI